MNPLEHLRYIARIKGQDPIDLALEATYAIAELADDRSLMVSALRRLLDRHPSLGVIWMVAARVADSLFPEEEAWSLIGEFSTYRRDLELIEFPSLYVESSGRITIMEESGISSKIGYNADRGLEFLRKNPSASLVVRSDLVSSRFAVISQCGVNLIRDYTSMGGSGGISISASDYALATVSIYESLESRLNLVASETDPVCLSTMDGVKAIVYQGSSFSPAIMDRLVGWRAPQEVLRPAGPLLG